MSRKMRVFVEIEFDHAFGTFDAAIAELESALEVYRDDPLWDEAEYDIRGIDTEVV